MTTTARVLWMDGLPLAPQHFQESDRLHHEALDARFRATWGTAWGLRHLVLDPRALREGVVRVESLEAVFADGTVVSVGPSSDLRVEDRHVSGLGPDRAEVTVYVAMTRERRGRPDLAGDHARLRIVEATSEDTHTETAAAPITIELGVPRLRIVFGHERRDELETLPLALVRKDENGELRALPTILGPLLCIGASAPLVARLSRLVERLGTRRAALVAARHERDGASIDVDPADLSRFMLASAIATHHPVLRHHLRRLDARPEVLYERLLALAGSLSILAADAELELPDYDAIEPERGFSTLFDRIDALLSATDRERARTIALEPRSDGLHFAQLDDEAARGERFYLAVQSTLAPKEVESSLGSLAKVASYGEIAGVLETATPGAPLSVVHRPPPEIPMRAGDTCFELAAADRYFRAALAERGIAVYLPARSFDPAHTRLTLVAIARHGAERTTDRGAPSLAARPRGNAA